MDCTIHVQCTSHEYTVLEFTCHSFLLVDDGTGSIKCSWHRNHSETHDKQIEDEPQVDMGNLVSMCGRLNVFRDQREIWINSIGQ